MGILFDVACLCGGGFAAFWAFYGMYEGTKEDFWGIRLLMMVFPAALIALLSSLLFDDAPWRCWLRFALFEGMSLLLLATELEHAWGYRSLDRYEGVMHLVLALLADAAIYAGVLGLSRPVRRRMSPA
ncbi:hypothetical protein [Pyxidicoccus sp. MSG2]|uniref:hypothetical protein n=1 Tax=Pyxidicoccus sp. MSG2 TaxID=2996790 RepID=UPI00226DE512|nr:hypothetical protein [Pyxidicoccus sp. MSG2]MCY1019192.1 hypothetical protein [Pyxidicoccus sp. MSG2]